MDYDMPSGSNSSILISDGAKNIFIIKVWNLSKENNKDNSTTLIYLFEVKHGNTKKMCEICSKIENTRGRRQWRLVFIVNFEHTYYLFSKIFIVDFEQVNVCCENEKWKQRQYYQYIYIHTVIQK